MIIIFLDFDGVLDNSYYDMILEKQGLPCSDQYGPVFDPLCVSNLARIIEATEAKIVVSSDWKQIMSFTELVDMWKSRSLPGELLNITPDISSHRGDEIDEWLSAQDKDIKYVIIDDLNACHFCEHQISRLLVVNPYTGLDFEVADRAISLLNQ